MGCPQKNIPTWKQSHRDSGVHGLPVTYVRRTRRCGVMGAPRTNQDLGSTDSERPMAMLVGSFSMLTEPKVNGFGRSHGRARSQAVGYGPPGCQTICHEMGFNGILNLKMVDSQRNPLSTKRFTQLRVIPS